MQTERLRPGESRVVAIASAPDVATETLGPFTWRVRLRTGVDRTDTIGVICPDKPADAPRPKVEPRREEPKPAVPPIGRP